MRPEEFSLVRDWVLPRFRPFRLPQRCELEGGALPSLTGEIQRHASDMRPHTHTHTLCYTERWDLDKLTSCTHPPCDYNTNYMLTDVPDRHMRSAQTCFFSLPLMAPTDVTHLVKVRQETTSYGFARLRLYTPNSARQFLKFSCDLPKSSQAPNWLSPCEEVRDAPPNQILFL